LLLLFGGSDEIVFADMKKQTISVLDAAGNTIKVIKRKLVFEQIGNFCPAFATYKGKPYLVNSTDGDLSDPFRREVSYLTSLFIKVPHLFDIV